MNEQQFAEQIRLALEESTERLPYRVSYRLQSAREAALARLAEPQMVPAQELALPSGGGTLALGGAPASGGGPVRWGRLAMSLFWVLVLVAGLFAISEWSEMDRADEAADIDMAVLTDEVPISAYADRGFGVFIKNTQE